MDKWKKYLIIDSNSKEDHCTGHRTEGTEALNWDTCTFVYSKEGHAIASVELHMSVSKLVN